MFTFQELIAEGYTRGDLRYGKASELFVPAIRDIWLAGAAAPTPFDIALAKTKRLDQPASGLVAARLLDLDAVHDLDPPDVVRRRTPDLGGDPIEANGILCTSGLQVAIDLAAVLDDERWEQANESALHQGLFTIDDELALLAELSRRRVPGTARMKRVLALRPKDAPPTESRLETIAVQLTRKAGVPEPTRQLEVRNEHDEFVARVDLCWPELGGFWELDGQGHRKQPVYDASRQSAVVIATGWLPNRMTWKEANITNWAVRRVQAFVEQAGTRWRPAL